MGGGRRRHPIGTNGNKKTFGDTPRPCQAKQPCLLPARLKTGPPAWQSKGATHLHRTAANWPHTLEGLALSPSPSPAPPEPGTMSPIGPDREPRVMGIPAIPRGSMPMIPAALSSDPMDAASAALSDLLLVLRSEEVLDDPGAPSFAAGFNPTTQVVSTREGKKVKTS